ncbi:MAG TPA: response regulator transcription factor [Dehalococcoidia bacterium]
MAKSTVLVVDDEAAIVELMRDFLEAEGYSVLTAPDGHAALALLEREPIDCLLLDVMMPGLSGFDLCRRIRERSDLPVLFLSARDRDVDKIRGLGLGDDYIVKSATPGEVVARIKNVLRRAGKIAATQPAAVLDFGELTIDLRAHEVRLAGRPLSFTARAFAVLRLLAEHPRQVFTRDQIFERCWGEEYGDRHTVTVHIGRIREKIEVNPNRPRYLITVWGVGYRFERPAAGTHEEQER